MHEARREPAAKMASMPSELRLPRRLRESAESDPELRDWARRLPAIADDVVARWRLRVGAPYEPGGGSSWVAPAYDQAGRLLVLKLGWRHREADHEADGLRLWDGNGVVHLYEATLVGDTWVMLMEPCEPGTQMASVLPEPAQDVVIAGLLQRLWVEPPVEHDFRTLTQMCQHWVEEFEEKRARRGGTLDDGLVREGLRLWVELPESADRQVLLCTDLHAENVLAAQREPWLVIDPKPYVGDPTYDPLQHMLNCAERLAADPVAFAHRIADLTGVDRDRLRLWLFARCVQESFGPMHVPGVIARLAP